MKILKKNKMIKLVNFETKFITKRFIDSLNNKNINKYLDIRKIKQNKKSAVKYYDERKKFKDYYIAILNEKNKLFGTITLRKLKKNTFSIGFMISKKKYFGTIYSKKSFQMALDFADKSLKAKKILAKTEKKNISSNFNLMRNNFKLYKKTDKDFFFVKHFKKYD